MKKTLSIAAAMAVTLTASHALAEDMLSATGDAAAGEKVFRKCMACHVVDQEQNRVGPHLVNIIDREIASVDGFRYSPAMVAYGEAEGEGDMKGAWTEERLAAYLANPRGVVKGTRMAFAGLRQEKEVADVLAYLKSKEVE